MFANLNSQRKTKSSRNMSFPETNQARLNRYEEREDPGRVIRRERAQVVAVAVEGGVEGVEVADMAEGEEVEVEVGTLATGSSRTRTKLRGATTTGNEVMTRRWRRRGHHPCSPIV